MTYRQWENLMIELQERRKTATPEEIKEINLQQMYLAENEPTNCYTGNCELF